MPTKMSDEDIGTRLQSAIKMSTSGSDTKLSVERREALDAYEGRSPAKAFRGDSGYVSLDTYDGVQAFAAQMLETFSANNRPVVFNPAKGEPLDQAHIRTERVMHILYNENNAFRLYQEVIIDSLLGRNGIAKVWWDEDIELEQYDVPPENLQMFLQNPKYGNPEITDVTVDENGVDIKTYHVQVKKDRSRVRVECVPLEDFFISSMATDIKSADVVGHRTAVTASELRKRGYDPDIISDLQDDEGLWQADPEKVTRFESTDDFMRISRDSETGDSSQRTCVLHEVYTKLDVDGTGIAQLYKVDMVGSTVLDKEKVSYKPFVSYCPLLFPHRFWGYSYVSILQRIQVYKTIVSRSILNHTLTTNSPRYLIGQAAGITNPRELLENKPGGVVNVKDVTQVAPLPQPSLNQYVFPVLEGLDSDKERLTGISETSQGLNKDAIAKQNSQQLIQDQIAVAGIRQKISARAFTEFLVELCSLIYLIETTNRSETDEVQISGDTWVQTDVSKWPEDVTCSTSIAVGYGEDQKEATKWLSIHKMFLDPATGVHLQYPAEKQWSVLQRAAQSQGIPDLSQILLPPSQAMPAPPPDPKDVAQVKMLEADANVKNSSAQVAVQNAQLAVQEAQWKHEETMAKIELERLKVVQSNKIAQMKLSHNIAIDAVETRLQMLEAQKANTVAVQDVPKPVGA